MMRTRSPRPGHLFSLYMLLSGFERLLIEKIRINPEHNVFGSLVTQAEVLSLLLVMAGLAGMLLTMEARRIWVKILLSAGVLSALSACVPL